MHIYKVRSEVTWSELAGTFEERMVTPDKALYDAACAVWNGSIDRRPMFVVHALTATEVQLAVRYARESNVPLAVRGQGHHVAGHGVCEGGIVLDVSAMNGIQIDPVSQTARVAPGVTVGEFIDAIEDQGMIVPVGSHSAVGLAGLTLGGGIGLLMGKYGLT